MMRATEMNTDKRKSIKLKVQSHPGMTEIRRKLVGAVGQLPALTAFQTKLEGVARLMLGGSKMPQRVVSLQRGGYAVRPCIGGVVITAAVFAPLGARENHKLVAPVTRLSDAIAYHFRASRMRASSNPYNLSVEQAKADAAVLQKELESLSKILSECGVAVMGNPVSAIEWATNPDSDERDIKITEYKALEERVTSAVKQVLDVDAKAKEEVEYLRVYVNTLEKRITELERLVCVVHAPVQPLNIDGVSPEPTRKPFTPIADAGIPSSF